MAPEFDHLFATPARVIVLKTSQYQDKPQGTEDQGYRDEN